MSTMRALMVRALTLLRNREGVVRLRFLMCPIDVTVLAADQEHLILKLPTDAVVAFQVAESDG